MRERIMEAIYKYLDENPEDEHMQRQTILMGKSNICTIHSFCLDVIKNNFYEIDVSPNFRIGDQTEIDLLKQDVLEDIFEEKYEQENEEFLRLINTYTHYNEDEKLKEIILKIYKYIQASPFPEEWLKENVEKFNLEDSLEKDFSETIWGDMLLKEFKEELNSLILQLKAIKKGVDRYTELEKYSRRIFEDIDKLEVLYANLDKWDKAYLIASTIKFDPWPTDKKIVLEEKEIAKDKRNAVKDKFKKLKEKILPYDSKQAMLDISSMYKIMLAISNIILEFSDKYRLAKKEKNIIDFNDIEHFALKILVKKEGDKYVPTQVAKTYIEKFTEIAIDEYQDSNLVQEYILSTVSKGNNIFMVGDVKQSIYKFRQARPELFIDKYENYKLKSEQEDGSNLKIQLFKNFRSRENILDVTNLVFENIMSRRLGDITYDENEYLNLGANFEKLEIGANYAGKTEFAIIDLKQEEEEKFVYDEESDEEEETEEIENIEDAEIEAKLVAGKIQELIKSKYQVFDKKIGYRNITYKDIVILLRATSKLAPIYEKALNDCKMPVFSDTGAQYLETVEIGTMMSLLKIIDNPMQDIPLVSVLRSPIARFHR